MSKPASSACGSELGGWHPIGILSCIYCLANWLQDYIEATLGPSNTRYASEKNCLAEKDKLWIRDNLF